MAAQRRFVADAAHELRAPLAALTLQAERLDATRLPAEARTRLAALRSGLARSRALLDQLLILARMQQRLEDGIPSTSIGPVLRAVVAAQMPLAHQRAIDLGIIGDAEIAVPMRELDLSTLLRNLTDNALRYAPEGGKVDVAISRGNGRILLEVRDTGPGIPAGERERIFEPFHRLASDTEGSGLGLAIVKAIADRYSSVIAVSDAGPGTRVVVAIPLA